MIAIVVEGDERADGLRIDDALGHAPMIPAAAGGSPRAGDPWRPGRRPGAVGTRAGRAAGAAMRRQARLSCRRAWCRSRPGQSSLMPLWASLTADWAGRAGRTPADEPRQDAIPRQRRAGDAQASGIQPLRAVRRRWRRPRRRGSWVVLLGRASASESDRPRHYPRRGEWLAPQGDPARVHERFRGSPRSACGAIRASAAAGAPNGAWSSRNPCMDWVKRGGRPAERLRHYPRRSRGAGRGRAGGRQSVAQSAGTRRRTVGPTPRHGRHS